MAKQVSNQGNVSLPAAAALNRRQVVTNVAGQAAYPSAIGDLPLGVVTNGTDAANEACAIDLFGKGETKLGVCSGVIPLNAKIVPAVDGSGDIRALPTAPGAYYVIGKASIEAGADNDEIAYVDQAPELVIVGAAHVADAAATDTAPVAKTYAAPAGGATADAEARASLAQLATDVDTIRTRQATIITELLALVAKQNTIIAALEAAGTLKSA